MTDRVHNCPRCELTFAHRGEVEDHLRRDHPVADVAPVGADGLARESVGHLLAALDPDRPASPAAEVAARLARRSGAHLELVSVAPDDLPPDAVESFLDDERRRHPDVHISTTALAGPDVVGALLAHVNQRDPDLLILDSHGRGPMGELILGSVSADMVRSSPAPTLLIGPNCGLDATVERFVVAIDGSDDARAGLDVAWSLKDVLGFGFEMVEVATGDATGNAPSGDLLESSELRRLASTLHPPVDDYDVLHGTDVSDAIIDHVRGERDAVLVLGTHGRSPGRPRVLGGVAARTVRHATVPVLVVSPEAADHHEKKAKSHHAPA